MTLEARVKQLDRETFGSLGFGGAVLGNLYAPVADEVAQDTVRAAGELGVRYFDTAPHYGFGLSEKRLGTALRELDPADAGARARHIADFIAGMTDRYALIEHARLFDSTPELR